MLLVSVIYKLENQKVEGLVDGKGKRRDDSSPKLQTFNLLRFENDGFQDWCGEVQLVNSR